MTLFRLDASVRSQGSVTRGVADTVQSAWLAEHPDGTIVHRDLGLHPLPGDAWTSVVGGMFSGEPPTSAQQAASALAKSLVDEVEAAEQYLLAVPLYNFGVASHFKIWTDLLLTDPRLAPGGPKVLAGRPAVLVTARGGGYGPGTPREGWDHSTPYLRRILGDVFGLDVRIVEAELTLADVTPAMADLRELAAAQLRDAHTVAGEHGKALALLFRERAAA